MTEKKQRGKSRARLTYEEVLEIFKENECELLESKYINSRTKMRFRCKCGNVLEKTLARFKDAPRCRDCGHSNKKINNNTIKYTYEEAKDIFEKGGCELLSTEYKNSSTKMKYICHCKEIKEITLNKFKQGQRCKECGNKRSGEKQGFTLEDARKEFENGNCKLIEDTYIDSKTPMKYICECNRVSTISLGSFKRGRRCYECGLDKNRVKLDDVVSYLREYGEGCEYISGECFDRYSVLTFKCSCEKFFDISYQRLRDGKKMCFECRDEATKISKIIGGVKNYVPYAEIQKLCKENKHVLLTPIEEYKGVTKTLGKIKCHCGNEFERNLANYTQGSDLGCHDCFLEKMKTMNKIPYSEIKNYIERKTPCTLLTKEDDYVNTRVKIQLMCDCKEVFEIEFHYFQVSGRESCSECLQRASKGEEEVKRVLDSLKINHNSQQTFDNCVDVHKLKFDFAVRDISGSIVALIEYDGKQHFEPVDFAGKGEEWAKEQFANTQRRDIIKNTYCEDNDIPLLRIPYWEFSNIEAIMTSFLNIHI